MSDGLERRHTANSALGSSTPESITVRGFDLANDLMGSVNLGDMAFLELTGRRPDGGESILFNAALVALVEHGITPSVLATRLTHLGAPESLQGAVAAGLLGLGSVFVGTIEEAARMLHEAPPAEPTGVDLQVLASGIVREHREHRRAIPGLGHPIHTMVDPRTTRLFSLAREHDQAGRYVGLMEAIAIEAEVQWGRRLPINVTGAIGAIAGELDIPWQICRGLGVMARSIGLVAHLLEEMRDPIAGEVWRHAEAEASPRIPDI